MNEIHLLGADGHRFSLRIVGYQFPSLTDCEDADSLVVEGRVSQGEMTWEFRAPCLMVGEVIELSSWFQRVIDGETVPEGLGFIEPCLYFEFVRTRWEILRIYFRLEARPPREEPKRHGVAWDCWVEVDASPSALERAVAGLREIVTSFPSRYSGDAEAS